MGREESDLRSRLDATPTNLPLDVPLDSTKGSIVLSWRSLEAGLFLRIRGRPEEVHLICHCGRSHWVVREKFAAAVTLEVLCHSCGRRGTFVLEGVSLPAP